MGEVLASFEEQMKEQNDYKLDYEYDYQPYDFSAGNQGWSKIQGHSYQIEQHYKG